MKVEGVYTYLCSNCETLFAVVSRFSVKGDNTESLNCPKCLKSSCIVGDGYIEHEMKCLGEEQKVNETIETTNKVIAESSLPAMLKAEHIASYLHVSKRVAYEIMDQKDFPLIRIRRSKRVNREDFFRWISEQKNTEERA